MGLNNLTFHFTQSCPIKGEDNDTKLIMAAFCYVLVQQFKETQINSKPPSPLVEFSKILFISTYSSRKSRIF